MSIQRSLRVTVGGGACGCNCMPGWPSRRWVALGRGSRKPAQPAGKAPHQLGESGQGADDDDESHDRTQKRNDQDEKDSEEPGGDPRVEVSDGWHLLLL